MTKLSDSATKKRDILWDELVGTDPSLFVSLVENAKRHVMVKSFDAGYEVGRDEIKFEIDRLKPIETLNDEQRSGDE